MDLSRAFRLKHPTRLALVGAGGKTTALFQLARELPPPVWVSATTHLAAEQLKLADTHIEATRRIDLVDFDSSEHTGVILFTGPIEEDQRTKGLNPELINTLHALADENKVDLFVEADGSRQLPAKAPADHEPAIPPWVEQVVVVAGLSVLGQPLDDQHVHRPERFSEITGYPLGKPLSSEALVRELTSPKGGLKGVPPYARLSVLLNQADTSELTDKAEEIAPYLLPFYQSVVIASLRNGVVLQVQERIAGIILAAGESKRLGSPKQLLDWMGEPFIRHVARTALEAGLSPVVVVTGSSAGDVSYALHGMPVVEVYNPDWASGQASSIKAGIEALPDRCGGAIFFLSDQPQVTTEVIYALEKAHSHNLSEITAPDINGRRGNPVLFDKKVFQDLKNLEGDVGGRALFSKYPVELIPWADSKLLFDVDTLEDYQRFLRFNSHE